MTFRIDTIKEAAERIKAKREKELVESMEYLEFMAFAHEWDIPEVEVIFD